LILPRAVPTGAFAWVVTTVGAGSDLTPGIANFNKSAGIAAFNKLDEHLADYLSKAFPGCR
jgi:hypothetical protein